MTLSEADTATARQAVLLAVGTASELERKSASKRLGVSRSYLAVKYAADWVAALVALFMLSPLLVFIAILIRLESEGPALFRQRRIGFGNREFTCFKFRTMQVNSHRAGDRDTAITMPNDPRVTRVGRVLRRLRLDELPQMLNILRGEMSWIGPRPEAVELSRWYEEHLPNYKLRFLVRPGITGLAQIRQGHVTGIDATSVKLAYDLDYVRSFSFAGDLRISTATLRIMATGRGSK